MATSSVESPFIISNRSLALILMADWALYGPPEDQPERTGNSRLGPREGRPLFS